MTRDPLTFTSPGHTFAFSGYLIMWALGVAELVGWGSANALEVETARWVGTLWAVALGASGAFGLLSIRHVYMSNAGVTVLRGLKDERIAAWVAGFCLLMYEAAIVARLGLGEAVNTQILVTGLGMASIFRVSQITTEVRRLHQALQDPLPANPVPLGEPETRGED